MTNSIRGDWRMRDQAGFWWAKEVKLIKEDISVKCLAGDWVKQFNRITGGWKIIGRACDFPGGFRVEVYPSEHVPLMWSSECAPFIGPLSQHTYNRIMSGDKVSV